MKISHMQPYFFIRADRQYVKISYDELISVESLENYVRIICKNNTYMTLLSLRQLEEILPSDLFCRVNRSCIISLDQVVAFDKDSVTLRTNRKIFFGGSYKGALEAKVKIVYSDVRRKPAETIVPVIESSTGNPVQADKNVIYLDKKQPALKSIAR